MLKTRFFVSCAALAAAVACAMAARAIAQDGTSAQEKERALIEILKSDAPPQDKAIPCKQLAVYGSKEAVPALAPLLADAQLSSWARIALEAIPDPAADEALRQALGKLQGRLLVGVINSLGVRRDAGSVEALVPRLKDADPEVASAAAVALGRIGGKAACAALEQALSGAPPAVRGAVAEGCILCAEKLLAAGQAAEAVRLYDVVRKADAPEPRNLEAIRGAILARQAAGVPILVECLQSPDKDLFAIALSTARELGGPEVANALVQELGKMQPAPEQAPKLLVIKKAQYGAGQQWADVTDKLAAAVSNNSLSIEASNNLAGDPAQGQVKELRVTYSVGGEEKSVAVPEGHMLQLGQGVPEANPRQVALIYALGDLGQPAARAAVLEAAKTGSWGTRVAAIHVLGRIGEAQAVPVLLEAAQGAGELGSAAVESLSDLKGNAVDAAIVGGLEKAEGPARAVLIQVVGYRGIGSAVPVLLKDVNSQDDQIRLAALNALGMTVGLDNLGTIIERLVKPKDAAEAEAASTALFLACTRMPDRNATADKLLAALPGAPAEAKVSILEVLGAMSGERALAGVGAAARSGDDALADAASRVLGGWMSADAGPVLLELATSGNAKYRTRALRGYIRIARQLDVPLADRTAMCREALKAAQRADEKKLVLEVLARYPSAEGLSLAVAQLSSGDVKAEAAQAAVKIAEKILPGNAAAVADAMKAVIAAGPGGDAANRAKALLDQAQK